MGFGFSSSGGGNVESFFRDEHIPRSPKALDWPILHAIDNGSIAAVEPLTGVIDVIYGGEDVNSIYRSTDRWYAITGSGDIVLINEDFEMDTLTGVGSSLQGSNRTVTGAMKGMITGVHYDGSFNPTYAGHFILDAINGEVLIQDGISDDDVDSVGDWGLGYSSFINDHQAVAILLNPDEHAEFYLYDTTESEMQHMGTYPGRIIQVSVTPDNHFYGVQSDNNTIKMLDDDISIANEVFLPDEIGDGAMLSTPDQTFAAVQLDSAPSSFNFNIYRLTTDLNLQESKVAFTTAPIMSYSPVGDGYVFTGSNIFNAYNLDDKIDMDYRLHADMGNHMAMASITPSYGAHPNEEPWSDF